MENKQIKSKGCECGCGHPHDHVSNHHETVTNHHHEDHACGCGHHHHEEHSHSADHPVPDDDESHPEPPAHYLTHTYIIDNIDCANCAAKIERKINDLEDIFSATITFATKQLKVTAKDPDAMIDQLVDIANTVENGVVIHKKESFKKKPNDNVNHKRKDFFALGSIILGVILLTLGEVYHSFSGADGTPLPLIVLYVILYLVLGYNVILTACKNILKGQIFDENFLMSVATIGAFIIGNYPEAVGVMIFYKIGEYFEEKAVAKSRQQIMDTIDLRPETATVIRNNQQTELPLEDIVIGDLILVHAGDRIPLDGYVVSGNSQIDTSPITGEPVPINAKPDHYVNSGCINLSGVITLKVDKELKDSMVTRILEAVENASSNKPKVDRFMTKFSRYYTPIVILLALLTAILPPLFLNGDWNYWVYTALTFLVMSCPCALVLSVPLAFFSGIGAASKKGILFKGGATIEALSNIDTIVMDKTGTITHGNFIIQEINTYSSFSKEELLAICASIEYASTHPIAKSIMNRVKEDQIAFEQINDITEISGKGMLGKLPSKDILIGNEKLMKEYQIDISSYQANAYGTTVLIALNQQLIGSIIISDTIKEDIKATINALHQKDLDTLMLTGDGYENSQSVAKEIGIKDFKAKLLPADKLAQVQQLQNQNKHVLFVGDGINDAPVLAGANVGAAMGTGADSAIESADVVFMTSKTRSILDALAISKITKKIAWQNIYVALGLKVLVMLISLFGFASMWLAIFADTGVAFLCILNSIRILYKDSH